MATLLSLRHPITFTIWRSREGKENMYKGIKIRFDFTVKKAKEKVNLESRRLKKCILFLLSLQDDQGRQWLQCECWWWWKRNFPCSSLSNPSRLTCLLRRGGFNNKIVEWGELGGIVSKKNIKWTNNKAKVRESRWEGALWNLYSLWQKKRKLLSSVGTKKKISKTIGRAWMYIFSPPTHSVSNSFADSFPHEAREKYTHSLL